MAGRYNASQDAQDAWDAGDASLASGRNADGSDAGSVFADDHRAFHYSMVIDETDDDGYEVVESMQIRPDRIQAYKNSGNSGESSIHDEINTIWDSSENEEYGDETNDGYFLDL